MLCSIPSTDQPSLVPKLREVADAICGQTAYHLSLVIVASAKCHARGVDPTSPFPTSSPRCRYCCFDFTSFSPLPMRHRERNAGRVFGHLATRRTANDQCRRLNVRFTEATHARAHISLNRPPRHQYCGGPTTVRLNYQNTETH
jgi:hypothetical protein